MHFFPNIRPIACSGLGLRLWGRQEPHQVTKIYIEILRETKVVTPSSKLTPLLYANVIKKTESTVNFEYLDPTVNGCKIQNSRVSTQSKS